MGHSTRRGWIMPPLKSWALSPTSLTRKTREQLWKEKVIKPGFHKNLQCLKETSSGPAFSWREWMRKGCSPVLRTGLGTPKLRAQNPGIPPLMVHPLPSICDTGSNKTQFLQIQRLSGSWRLFWHKLMTIWGDGLRDKFQSAGAAITNSIARVIPSMEHFHITILKSGETRFYSWVCQTGISSVSSHGLPIPLSFLSPSSYNDTTPVRLGHLQSGIIYQNYPLNILFQMKSRWRLGLQLGVETIAMGILVCCFSLGKASCPSRRLTPPSLEGMSHLSSRSWLHSLLHSSHPSTFPLFLPAPASLLFRWDCGAYVSIPAGSPMVTPLNNHPSLPYLTGSPPARLQDSGNRLKQDGSAQFTFCEEIVLSSLGYVLIGT